MLSLPVTRHDNARIVPDPSRVITKPFLPGEELLPDGSQRIDVAVRRLLAMPETDVKATLEGTRDDFAARHRAFDTIVDDNFALVADRCSLPDDLSADRRALIGTYFTHEYSIEAAAIGNPSMVVSPDQSGVEDGACRFVMSLRAIGEGHISSIEFRSGVVGADMQVRIETPSRFAATGRRSSVVHERAFFVTKLSELGVFDAATQAVIERLDTLFTMSDLEAAMRVNDAGDAGPSMPQAAAHTLHWLASSNYSTAFPAESTLSERVIFPAGPTESRGMEDVRLVRFVGDDGAVTYYGTYTAFDGHQIMPQLLETADFVSFRITTMAGRCAHNKGMALFPRKVNGRYLALGRHDNVNNFLMSSDNVRVWYQTELIQEPEQPWELMQLGNCGSPLETDAGWLVITHGVGPMRRYSLGALLLDLDDPARVIGHLRAPLLVPIDEEREGYVPNVVYSCGSMIHQGHLVIPYGFADVGAGVATVPLDDLLSLLQE